MNKCKWTFEGEFWGTECGNAHYFTVDGPKENQYVYCPYCGKEIVVKEIKEPMTIEQWLIDNYPGYLECGSICCEIAIECHKWSVANERLKHEPQFSVDALFIRWAPNTGAYSKREIFELGCKAQDKNRGYDAQELD